MGFSNTLIVLSPREWHSLKEPRLETPKRAASFTLWQPVSIIAFGHTASTMAACVARAFYRPMHEALRTKRADILAPLIVPLSHRETLATPWLHEAVARGEVVGGESVVEPAVNDAIFLPPYVEEIVAHNARLTLDGEARWKDVGFGLHPITHKPPFLWFPCGEIADWLERAETEEGDEFQKLRDEKPDFLAVYRGHRAFLREMSATQARGMFVFEDSQLPIHTH